MVVTDVLATHVVDASPLRPNLFVLLRIRLVSRSELFWLRMPWLLVNTSSVRSLDVCLGFVDSMESTRSFDANVSLGGGSCADGGGGLFAKRVAF